MFALLEIADMLGPAAACMAAAAAEVAEVTEAVVWLTRYSLRVSVVILFICSSLACGLRFFSLFCIWLTAGT